MTFKQLLALSPSERLNELLMFRIWLAKYR